MEEYKTWFGVPRKEIKWYPRIDPAKCIGCGLCTQVCGRGVYSYDFADRKSVVIKPYNCLVGCLTCSNLCPAGAIDFPDPGVARDAARKFGIFKVVRERLKEHFEEFLEKTEKYRENVGKD
ncbi:MAG: 4Fe-4S binding protein [Archaeoglobus sp.]|nr:4Fe-4S binding protein [Archaeoglobus sp.]